MKLKLCTVGVTMLLLAACSAPKDISYFQDFMPGDSTLTISEPIEIRFKPKDKISILINSQDPRLSNLFNLPILTSQIGMDSNYAQNRGLSGYTVDKNGYIDFPVLGQIHVEGMTREEVALTIKNQLVQQDLLKDPVITVEFMNLTVSVLGEVARPGRYNIERDHLTILDALSLAGDLTIFGKRDDLKVLRQGVSSQDVYHVNLNSAKDLCASPVYYLQQGDVVYVEPNDTRKRQSTVNGNNIRSTSFWISFCSLLTSVGILVFK